MARAQRLAFVTRLHFVAAVVGARAVAFAAAQLDILGHQRRRRGQLTVREVLGVESVDSLAAHSVAHRLIGDAHALGLRLVREAAKPRQQPSSSVVIDVVGHSISQSIRCTRRAAPRGIARLSTILGQLRSVK